MSFVKLLKAISQACSTGQQSHHHGVARRGTDNNITAAAWRGVVAPTAPASASPRGRQPRGDAATRRDDAPYGTPYDTPDSALVRHPVPARRREKLRGKRASCCALLALCFHPHCTRLHVLMTAEFGARTAVNGKGRRASRPSRRRWARPRRRRPSWTLNFLAPRKQGILSWRPLHA